MAREIQRNRNEFLDEERELYDEEMGAWWNPATWKGPEAGSSSSSSPSSSSAPSSSSSSPGFFSKLNPFNRSTPSASSPAPSASSSSSSPGFFSKLNPFASSAPAAPASSSSPTASPSASASTSVSKPSTGNIFNPFSWGSKKDEPSAPRAEAVASVAPAMSVPAPAKEVPKEKDLQPQGIDVASLIPIASKLLDLPKTAQQMQAPATPPYQPFAAVPPSPPFQPFAPLAPAAPLAIATASTSYAPQINSVLRTSGLALRPRVMSRDQVDDVTAKLEQLGVPGAEQVFGNYMATNGIAQMGAFVVRTRRKTAPFETSFPRIKLPNGKISYMIPKGTIFQRTIGRTNVLLKSCGQHRQLGLMVQSVRVSGTVGNSTDPITRALALVQGDAPDRRTVRIARDYGAFVKLRINPPTADELLVQMHSGSPVPTSLKLHLPTR